MADKKFGTAINCMDGRVQAPVADWVKNRFGVDYVDMITLPGPDKVLAERADVRDIYDRAEISVKKHGSKIIVLAGHHNCVGNAVDKEGHLGHIKKAVDAVKGWNLDVKKKEEDDRAGGDKELF